MKDPVTHAERLHHVVAELHRYSGKKHMSSSYTMVICPFHNDTSPSGQVYHGPETRIPGFFKCLSCGAKAQWNKVAPLLGLTPFVAGKPEDAYATPILGLTDEEDADNVERILVPIPKHKVWRGIRTNLLRKIGCKLDVTYKTKFVYLPIMVNGTERGYIRARLKKDESGKYPSYLNKKGAWSKKYGLFPFDFSIKMMRELGSSSIVLVEGPRDALRLLSMNIPAVALLGTTSWTARKAALLEMHGVKRVITLMDGDDAGRAASELITPDLKNHVKVKEMRLWSMKGSPYRAYAQMSKKKQQQYKSGLWDPGNCPKHILKALRDRYF